MLAAVAGTRPRACGYPWSSPASSFMPTEWLLRPVSKDARVGEQIAFEWKLVY